MNPADEPGSLPLFSCVPQPQNPDSIGLDLVTHFVVTDDQLAYVALPEIGQPLAQMGMSPKVLRACLELRKNGLRRAEIERRKEGVQPDKIAKRLAGPDHAHVGGGKGLSVPRLSIQASTSL